MANGSNGNGNGGSGIGRPWIFVGAIVILVLLASAFMSLRPRRIRVVIAKPQRIDISSSITTNGRVEPVQNFEAHAPIATTVRKLLVKEGQSVHRGQLVLQLDDSAAKAQMAKAEAQLKAAQAGSTAIKQGGTQEEVLTRKADLEKAQQELTLANRNLDAVKRLQEKGAASQDEVAAAQQRTAKAQADVQLLTSKNGGRFSPEDRSRAAADVADAEAALQAARQMIADSNVTAPFDGTVYSLPVRQGAWVNAGDLLAQVADMSAMQIRTFVDEPEIGRLASGQMVRITWDAVPGRIWEGRVKSIPSNVVQHNTRTVGEVICSVNNNDGKLIPNVNISAVIITSSHPNALVVPREAVRDDGGKSVVFTVNDDHLERKTVKTGVASLTQVEIENGIKDTDTVAVQSVSPTPLTDGIGVKIVDAPQ